MLGLLFLVASIVSLITFFIKVKDNQNTTALLMFYVTDIIMYAISTTACLVAGYKMRKLKYVTNRHRVHQLDDILLIIACIGQLMFCIFSTVENRKCAFLNRMFDL